MARKKSSVMTTLEKIVMVMNMSIRHGNVFNKTLSDNLRLYSQSQMATLPTGLTTNYVCLGYHADQFNTRNMHFVFLQTIEYHVAS